MKIKEKTKVGAISGFLISVFIVLLASYLGHKFTIQELIFLIGGATVFSTLYFTFAKSK